MLADELIALHAHPREVPPFTQVDSTLTPTRGYEAALALHRHRLAEGWKAVGRKIGFTNRTIWPEYGVYTPMWAHVYDSTVTFFDGIEGSLAIGHLAEPRIEPEILLHFKTSPSGATTEAEILDCVDWIAHSVEIVQSHFPAWKFKAADTAAAFGLHGALVVGPPRPIAELGEPAALIQKLRTFKLALSRGRSVAIPIAANGMMTQ